MDTKLKNNRNKRIIVAVAALLLISLGTMCFFPSIRKSAQEKLEIMDTEAKEELEVNSNLVEQIYCGAYVLYLEAAQRGSVKTAADVYLAVDENLKPKTIENGDDGTAEDYDWDEDVSRLLNDVVDRWSQEFETYRSMIDYCILMEDGSYEKNTSQPLENIIGSSGKEAEELKAYYSDYFILQFDKDGILNIEPLYSNTVKPDDLIKAFQQTDREKLLRDELENYYGEIPSGYNFNTPVNFKMVIAIPADMQESVNLGIYSNSDSYGGRDYRQMMTAYADAGAVVLFYGGLALVVLLVFLMTNSKLWKADISMNRFGNWYLMEAAAVGVICILGMMESFIGTMRGSDGFMQLENLISGATVSIFGMVMNLFETLCIIFSIFGIWYLSVRFIRPVFSLGLREYVRQYSFFYQIFPWVKKKWEALKDETEHIDFSEKSTKTIVKIVVLNFLVLAACSFLWFFGIFVLIIYSIVVFYIIKNYYNKAERNYQALMRGVGRIAEGDLDSEITEDIGMFEPFKAELVKIRSGFKKAVEEEVKSQRMKTELITNVSHDLKTPLTAITTYVELLKNENITPEERRSYIETLERKSLRLKVLIEDLFEVSKATSNNISLNLVEVDVINLLKQVSIEHTDKFKAQRLDLRWKVPEERVVLMLDSQKTYRIFENLFVNVLKYAMTNSRVYLEVMLNTEDVEITMKNMSAEELHVNGEEITERFVRGDSARNTEGSGLGLAIAKSFTEAQKGHLFVEVDGDLFKVIIRFVRSDSVKASETQETEEINKETS